MDMYGLTYSLYHPEGCACQRDQTAFILYSHQFCNLGVRIVTPSVQKASVFLILHSLTASQH